MKAPVKTTTECAMPIELIHPVIGLTFLAVCLMATEILVQTRRGN